MDTLGQDVTWKRKLLLVEVKLLHEAENTVLSIGTRSLEQGNILKPGKENQSFFTAILPEYGGWGSGSL